MSHGIRLFFSNRHWLVACAYVILFLGCTVFGLGFTAVNAFAQVIEPPIPAPPSPPLPPEWVSPALPQLVKVELHAIEAEVDGSVATVSVTQVLRNDGGQTAEGIYVFPLPKDAAVSDFQMTVDGETLEGKLLTREEARRIYEQIVRRQRQLHGIEAKNVSHQRIMRTLLPLQHILPGGGVQPLLQTLN